MLKIKKKFKQIFITYHLPPFFLTLLLILIFQHPIAILICHLTNVMNNRLLSDLIVLAVPLIALVIWTFFFLNNIRSSRYSSLTGGRSYSYDAGHYNRTFHELV